MCVFVFVCVHACVCGECACVHACVVCLLSEQVLEREGESRGMIVSIRVRPYNFPPIKFLYRSTTCLVLVARVGTN